MSPSAGAKQLRSLVNVLKRYMSMSDMTAKRLAYKWSQSDSKDAMMTTFLHKAIEEQIDLFRTQSFAKFGLDIAVYPADGAVGQKIMLPSFGTIKIGYKAYVFATRHNDDPAKIMRVRLAPGNVEVFYCDMWHPISEYLEEVATESNSPQTMQMAYDAQYNWWRVNGKCFDIMALPGEIRNAIFDQVFDPVNRPYPNDKSRKRQLTPKPDLTIMKLNKALHNESNHRFYQTTTFLIEHGNLLSKLLINKRRCDNLRNITLALSHSGYFTLFRFDASNAVLPHDFTIHRLRETSLAKLEIHIAAPSKIASRAWLEGACQKTVVDRIFDAAWPSINGLPVTITGHVEPTQKQALEARLKTAQDEYKKWAALKKTATGKTATLREYDAFLEKMNQEPVGGVRLDGEACAETEGEAETIRMSYKEFKDSMKCRCEHDCTESF